MLVVMPKDLTAFEASLSPAVINGVVGSLKEHWIGLDLPKFTVRTKLKLADTLKSMGMTDAFDGDEGRLLRHRRPGRDREVR